MKTSVLHVGKLRPRRKDIPRSYSKRVVRRDKMPCSVPICYTVSFPPISHSLLMSQRSQVSGFWGLPEKHAEDKLLRCSNIVSDSEI